jgi:hypothetical protein
MRAGSGDGGEGRPLLRRRSFLTGLAAASASVALPLPRGSAIAAPRSAPSTVSGKIVARQIDHLMPAALGELATRGGAPVGVDTGSTGGAALSLTSPVIDAGQLFERVGAHFRAAPGSEGGMFVEVRSSPDGLSWNEWTSLGIDEHLADRYTNTHYLPPRPVPQSSRYAQYRVWLTGGRPEDLGQLSLTVLDVNDLNAGPVARLLQGVGGALRGFGESGYALGASGASKILTRADWGADESLMKWTPKNVAAQKALVHHTVTDDGGTNVAATIRSIYYFHAVTRGWGDIGYSFIVDKFGNIWIGRQGGDNVVAGHAYGWNDGTVGIAALGDYSVTPPTGQLQGAIANIVAMRFRQLGVQPYGSGSFTHEEQRSDGSWIKVTLTVANMLGHRDCPYTVGQTGGQTACPGGSLYGMLGGLRSLAQSAWTSGYTYLTRIDTQLAGGGYPGQVVQVPVLVTNLGTTAIPAGTVVSYRLLRAGSVVGQGTGAALAQPIAPGATGSASVAFSAPPLGEYVVRWDLQTAGMWWNTLYTTPFHDQWFRSADWSASWLDDNVSRAWNAGETRTTTVTVQNDGGRVWNASGVDPVRIGYYWIDNTTGKRMDGPRQPLPQDVAPGQVITLTFPMSAPTYPTNYTNVLDLYKENEFWFRDKGLAPDDTPITVSTDFKAAYSVGGALPGFEAGKAATVPLTITNLGKGLFPAAGAYPVDLGYHWVDPTGKAVVWDGARTKLPADLGPGQSVTIPASVVAPDKGGAFTLRFDLVQEGIGWFSSKGVATADLAVNVAGPVIPAYGATYQPGAATFALSGAQAAVPITITNSSNFTWSPAGANPINLSYHWINAGGTVRVWEGLRTKLPADLAPGQSVTLQAQVAFPNAESGYTLRWDLVQEGVTWFSGKGVRPFDQAVVVGPPPFYGGSIDVSKVPSAMPTRMTTSVPLRVQNLSNFPWDATVNLSYHWYDASGKAVVWDGLRTSLAGIAAGEVRPVSASVIAPQAPGMYTLKLDIVQEGVTWFSAQGMQLAAVPVTVAVAQYGALYDGPDAITGAANASVVVPVTLTNVGTLAWQTGVVNLSYHLLTGAGAVVAWDGQRTPLASAIAPGQTVVLSAIVKLPPAAGAYSLRWDLVQEGVTWFSGQGVPTDTSAVTGQ